MEVERLHIRMDILQKVQESVKVLVDRKLYTLLIIEESMLAYRHFPSISRTQYPGSESSDSVVSDDYVSDVYYGRSYEGKKDDSSTDNIEEFSNHEEGEFCEGSGHFRGHTTSIYRREGKVCASGNSINRVGSGDGCGVGNSVNMLGT